MQSNLPVSHRLADAISLLRAHLIQEFGADYEFTIRAKGEVIAHSSRTNAVYATRRPKRVRVYFGVWQGEIGELIEAGHGDSSHRVKMANNVVLAVRPDQYEIVDTVE